MDQKNQENISIPTVGDENSSSMGAIRVNHSVIANIVRLSTLSVDGVVGIGRTSMRSKIERFFSKDGDCDGIRISEDANGGYVIDIQVILKFGTELAKVAFDIQQTVVRQVTSMTMKAVSLVNITIESVVQVKDDDAPNTEYAIN
ncbi:MAG: Asp23/Gls24 family envelope stress response protein [Opitutales bacterium]|nr:Asp23/Gls24 family envelope stress response protein [Opitutales bacterium]